MAAGQIYGEKKSIRSVAMALCVCVREIESVLYEQIKTDLNIDFEIISVILASTQKGRNSGHFGLTLLPFSFPYNAVFRML